MHVNYPGDVRTSKLVRLIIGDANIPSAETVLNIPGDCNADRIINLVDFSILAFWYGQGEPAGLRGHQPRQHHQPDRFFHTGVLLDRLDI